MARFAAGRIPPSYRRPWLLERVTVIMISMGLLLAGSKRDGKGAIVSFRN